MSTNIFLFGWGLGLLYTSIIAIISIIMNFGIGIFIGIGLIGIGCLIINYINRDNEE